MMKDIIINLFGTYTPVLYENADGVLQVADGIGAIDVPYVLGVLLFAICLSSLFKIIMSIFRG